MARTGLAGRVDAILSDLAVEAVLDADGDSGDDDSEDSERGEGGEDSEEAQDKAGQ